MKTYLNSECVLNIGLSCAIDSVAALALEENEREIYPEDCI